MGRATAGHPDHWNRVYRRDRLEAPAAVRRSRDCGSGARGGGRTRPTISPVATLVGTAEPDYAEDMVPVLTLLAVVGTSMTPMPIVPCTDGPPYYAFELVTTKNVPGTGLATGQVEAAVPGSSPFAVQLAADGSYAYDLQISIDRMKTPRQGRLIAWVTTPEIDRIERLGALDEHLRGSGRVDWNKYIVVVTLEATDDPDQEIWSGPIVLRGMSRSGMMHTMAGHGALQQENCAAYGYGN